MSGLAGLLAHHVEPGIYRWHGHFPVEDVRHTVEHAGWQLRRGRRLAPHHQGGVPRGGRDARWTSPTTTARTSTRSPTASATSPPATARAGSCSGTAGDPSPARTTVPSPSRSPCSAAGSTPTRAAASPSCSAATAPTSTASPPWTEAARRVSKPTDVLGSIRPPGRWRRSPAGGVRRGLARRCRPRARAPVAVVASSPITCSTCSWAPESSMIRRSSATSASVRGVPSAASSRAASCRRCRVEGEGDEHGALALDQVAAGRLPGRRRVAEDAEQVVAQLEGLAQREPERAELAQLRPAYPPARVAPMCSGRSMEYFADL